MRISISEDTTETEARVIAEAMATHYGETVTVLSDSGEEIASADDDGDGEQPGDTKQEPDIGPTDREEDLIDEIEAIHEGGPEKYKEQLPEQGKLFVRDRIDLWFGEDFLFEDGTFAAFDDDDTLPADGLITGAAE
ncbi:MAG: hypothetical protein ACI9PP_001068, partial [Halobacteriales archaeon]